MVPITVRPTQPSRLRPRWPMKQAFVALAAAVEPGHQDAQGHAGRQHARRWPRSSAPAGRTGPAVHRGTGPRSRRRGRARSAPTRMPPTSTSGYQPTTTPSSPATAPTVCALSRSPSESAVAEGLAAQQGVGEVLAPDQDGRAHRAEQQQVHQQPARRRAAGGAAGSTITAAGQPGRHQDARDDVPEPVFIGASLAVVRRGGVAAGCARLAAAAPCARAVPGTADAAPRPTATATNSSTATMLNTPPHCTSTGQP